MLKRERAVAEVLAAYAEVDRLRGECQRLADQVTRLEGRGASLTRRVDRAARKALLDAAVRCRTVGAYRDGDGEVVTLDYEGWLDNVFFRIPENVTMAEFMDVFGDELREIYEAERREGIERFEAHEAAEARGGREDG